MQFTCCIPNSSPTSSLRILRKVTHLLTNNIRIQTLSEASTPFHHFKTMQCPVLWTMFRTKFIRAERVTGPIILLWSYYFNQNTKSKEWYLLEMTFGSCTSSLIFFTTLTRKTELTFRAWSIQQSDLTCLLISSFRTFWAYNCFSWQLFRWTLPRELSGAYRIRM